MATTLLLATLAAGCGSASSSSSSSSRQAGGDATNRTTATAAAASASIPAGFTRYQAQGFSFAAPSGLKVAPGNIAGLPAGATAYILTPGGKPEQHTNVQIIEGYNPNLQFDIDQVATNLREADATNSSVRDVRTTERAVTVAGAERARIVAESYVERASKTMFHRTWLMVSPKAGVLMDLVVVDEPRLGGSLDAATVLNSFRIGS